MMDSLRYALIDEYAGEWIDLFLIGREIAPQDMGVPDDILTDLIDEVNRRRFALTKAIDNARHQTPCPCILCKIGRGEITPIVLFIRPKGK